MRLTAIASLTLALGAIVVLATLGGAVAYARPLFAGACAVALIAAAIGMGRRYRLPPLGWIAWVFAPPLALCLLQAAPLPWTHPWVARDVALLGVTAPCWSLDPAGTARAVVWLTALAGAALVWHCHARGERVRVLAWALVGVACLHAAVALVLALIGVDFPSPSEDFQARGVFIYHNHAAAFAACVLPLAVLLARDQRRAWAWMLVGLLALAVLLSGSRGGTLVACVVLLPLAWRSLPRRHRGWWFAGLCTGIAAYLVAIGLHEVGMRFARLVGPEGLTLDGRLTIWQKTLPLIRTATALGTGANSTEAIWWRTGSDDFPGFVVNHIHSDPLEWLLEYGWGGALLIGLGLGIAAWQLACRRPADRVLYRGGILGLVILGLHSTADFIWNREAIALEAVILAILAWEGRERHEAREVTSARGVRLLCLALAAVLLVLLPSAWTAAHGREQVRSYQAWAVGRAEAGLSLAAAPAERLRQLPPTTAVVAVAQARLALDAHDAAPGSTTAPALLATAAERLRQAAALAPADGGAWVERLRLALAQGPSGGPALASAIDRVLTWTPTWSYAQARLLACLRTHGIAALPQDQRVRVVRGLLAIDQPAPAWFFPFAQAIIGSDALTSWLSTQAGPALAASAVPYLARVGSCAQWWHRYRALLPPRLLLDPCQAPLQPILADACQVRLALPASAEERRDLAETITRAGMTMPPELAAALSADGPPYALWARPIGLADDATRETLIPLLRPLLFRPWARSWYDRCLDARAALGGASLRVGEGADPRLLLAVLARAPHLLPGEVARLQAELAALRLPRWQPLPGGRWTDLLVAAPPPPLAALGSWEGVVVDGSWRGWQRGLLALGDLPAGLHQVVLLDPPGMALQVSAAR